MKRKALKTLLAMALVGVTTVASAVPVSSLGVGGGTITSGDKVFWDFSWLPVSSGAPAASAVSVISYQDPITHLFGIQINLGLAATSAFGTTKTEDGILTYSVKPTGNNIITDIHQRIIGGGILDNPAQGFWSVSSVESVRDLTSGNVLASLTSGATNVDPLSHLNTFVDLSAPSLSLLVEKDINVQVNGGTAQISAIFQTFSQKGTRKVPDGASTVSLLGFVLLGVEGLRRKLAR